MDQQSLVGSNEGDSHSLIDRMVAGDETALMTTPLSPQLLTHLLKEHSAIIGRIMHDWPVIANQLTSAVELYGLDRSLLPATQLTSWEELRAYYGSEETTTTKDIVQAVFTRGEMAEIELVVNSGQITHLDALKIAIDAKNVDGFIWLLNAAQSIKAAASPLLTEADLSNLLSLIVDSEGDAHRMELASALMDFAASNDYQIDITYDLALRAIRSPGVGLQVLIISQLKKIPPELVEQAVLQAEPTVVLYLVKRGGEVAYSVALEAAMQQNRSLLIFLLREWAQL